MIPVRGQVVVVAVVVATATTGCGLGAGEASEGEATMTVTRNYGATDIVDITIPDPRPTDTVVRALDRETEITTRYGGGFVQSIEGVAGGIEDGRSRDWFFYVNGIESPIGSAEVAIDPDDRIWWDHHDWTDVMRVPAVVGSFPQPFEASSGSGELPIEVACAAAESACELVGEALEEEGIETDTVAISKDAAGERPRVVVATLDDLESEPEGALIDSGPGGSGVFVRGGAGPELDLLDESLEVRRSGPVGLVAAVSPGAGPPTWVVTGSDDALVAEAAELLGGGSLHNRFAVAVTADGETIPVPVR